MPPTTTLDDLKSAVKGFQFLLEKAISMGLEVIPHRINQDIVESWFGHQRQAGGGNRNMTGKKFN